jgi:hypothetical protein
MMCGCTSKQEKCHFFYSYFVIFSGFWVVFFKKKIDECIFFPLMEKSFPRRTYSPMPSFPGCLEIGRESFFSGLAFWSLLF